MIVREVLCGLASVTALCSIAQAVPLVQAFHYNSSGVQFFYENISDTSPDSGETMTVHLKDATRKIVIVSGTTVDESDLVPDTSNSIDIGMIRFDTANIPSEGANRRILVSIGDYFATGENTSSPYVRWGRHWGGIVTPKVSGGADDARVTIRLCACVGNAIA